MSASISCTKEMLSTGESGPTPSPACCSGGTSVGSGASVGAWVGACVGAWVGVFVGMDTTRLFSTQYRR